MVFHRGPSLVHLLCDLFYFLEGVAVASYSDDITIYGVDKTNDLVIQEVENFSEVFSSVI